MRRCHACGLAFRQQTPSTEPVSFRLSAGYSKGEEHRMRLSSAANRSAKDVT